MTTFQITLIRAKDLVTSDSCLEGDKSDPFVIFQIGKEQQQSSCISSNLNPIWTPPEQFEFHILRPEHDVLTIHVMDHDTYSKHDLIGTLKLPVAKYLQHLDVFQHEVHDLEIPTEYKSQHHCKSTIELKLCLRQDKEIKQTLRMWENQVWGLMTGWTPSDTEIYRQWSTYDETATSHNFQQVAPLPPSGMEGEGWLFELNSEGEDGWMYGHNFLGPFSTSCSMLTSVRRRLWTNHCIPASL